MATGHNPSSLNAAASLAILTANLNCCCLSGSAHPCL